MLLKPHFQPKIEGLEKILNSGKIVINNFGVSNAIPNRRPGQAPKAEKYVVTTIDNG